MWFRRRRPAALSLPELRWLRPQVGPAETELCEQLEAGFSQDERVVRAWLLCAQYAGEPEGTNHVVLALRLRDRGSDSRVAREIGSVFADLFRRGAALDVAFVTDGTDDPPFDPFFSR